MIKARPSFFSDWGRHSLSVAFRKRWGSFEVDGREYKYGDIVGLDKDSAAQLLCQAVQFNQPLIGCMAFESLSLRAAGNATQLWTDVMASLATQHDSMACVMMAQLVHRYDCDRELESLTLTARSSYQVGKAYADLAQVAKGKNKATMQTRKKLAMHHLGQARERCEAEGKEDGADPYRQAAIVAALAASVAAAYEAAAYLQWKGTRTTALSE